MEISHTTQYLLTYQHGNYPIFMSNEALYIFYMLILFHIALLSMLIHIDNLLFLKIIIIVLLFKI